MKITSDPINNYTFKALIKEKHHKFRITLSIFQTISSCAFLFFQDKLVSWTEPTEEDFSAPDSDGGPGSLGRPVRLSPEQKRESKASMGLHQLSIVASDLVPLNRSLPDYRNPEWVAN